MLQNLFEAEVGLQNPVARLVSPQMALVELRAQPVIPPRPMGLGYYDQLEPLVLARAFPQVESMVRLMVGQ